MGDHPGSRYGSRPIRITDGCHEYDVTIEDKRLNFLFDYKPDAGNLIVFLHGLACSRNTFRYALNEQYFPNASLFLPDLVGFGRSCKPDQFSYTMDDQAKLCEQLLEQLPPAEIQVVAHSMGGVVGLLFSPHLFDRVDAFANIEGNLIADDCGMLSRGISDASLEEYRLRIFEEQKTRFSDDPVLEYEHTTPIAVHRSARSMVEWSDTGELLERFTRLPCKTGYFWGDKNHEMPILRKLEGIRTYMIPGSGHGMMLDNPREFYATVAEFLEL